jgi:uncharacterized membrane protein YkoI
MMQIRIKHLIAGIAVVAALVLTGGGIAFATTGQDKGAEGPDVSISGPALTKATAAALAATGEGRVTDTEVGDEESYYEVEVTLDNGSEVDVQLDEALRLVEIN